MRPGRPFSPVSVSVPFLRATPSDGIGTELISAHATTQNKDNDDGSATTTTTTTGKHVRALMATVALASTCLLFSVPESFAATPTTTTTTTTTTPPTPSAGVVSSNNYRCPKLVASQTLGIQNVVRQSTKIPRPSALGSSEAAALYCPMKASDSYDDASEDAYRYSVRGLIYLPSGNNREDREDSNRSDGTQQQKQQQQQLSSALSTSSESSLVVTVRSSRDPSSSILLMGARIPMAQIESFPVSFVLSSGNFLMADTAWERSILDASDALSVTARVVCDKTSSNGGGSGNGSGNDSGCPSQELEGIGIARTLLVPNIGGDGGDDNDNDNDFRKVRGAASIRLGRATAPDPLYTW